MQIMRTIYSITNHQSINQSTEQSPIRLQSALDRTIEVCIYCNMSYWPILYTLHWLPVSEWISFKMILPTGASITGTARELCIPVLGVNRVGDTCCCALPSPPIILPPHIELPQLSSPATLLPLLIRIPLTSTSTKHSLLTPPTLLPTGVDLSKIYGANQNIGEVEKGGNY